MMVSGYDELDYVEIEYPWEHALSNGTSAPFYITPDTRNEIRNDLKLRPDSDIFIVTYPKSGTTWTQNIVRHLLFTSDVQPYSDMSLNTRLPWLDCLGFQAADLETWPSPRVFKSHNTPDELDSMVLKGNKVKVIYVVRDPRDVAVSFYYHHAKVILTAPELKERIPNFFQFMPDATFEDFYKVFTRDPTFAYYGLWEDHVDGWLALREQHDMLVVRYEELQEDPKREILKIAEFLDVKVTDEKLDDVAMKTTISFMKKDIKCGLASTKGVDTSVLRKGIVGDWENHFIGEHLKNEAEELRKIAEDMYKKYNI